MVMCIALVVRVNVIKFKEAVVLVHAVTQWSDSGGIEAYLSGQLASFSALTLLVGSYDL